MDSSEDDHCRNPAKFKCHDDSIEALESLQSQLAQNAQNAATTEAQLEVKSTNASIVLNSIRTSLTPVFHT